VTFIRKIATKVSAKLRKN